MPPIELTARARELGDRLRQLRKAAGLTGQELADKLGWSTATVSRTESGYRKINEMNVVRYAAFCGVEPDRLDELLNLCREGVSAGFWMPRELNSLIFYESTASELHNYEPMAVPGLLQTEHYAAALMSREQLPPELLRRRVEMRMERQRLLNQASAVRLRFYVHEQALRLPVGGYQVMNEQMLKLVLLADVPWISIRILPIDRGERSTCGGSFVLFEYPEHSPLVYMEDGVVHMFIEDDRAVLKYQRRLDSIARVALSEKQSRVLLAGLASRYDRAEGPRDVPRRVANE